LCAVSRHKPAQSETFPNGKEAQQWAQSIEAAIREGRHFPHAAARRTSFDALAKDYTETVLAEFDEKERARRTRQLNGGQVRNLFNELMEGFDALADQRAGKRALRRHAVKPRLAPQIQAGGAVLTLRCTLRVWTRLRLPEQFPETPASTGTILQASLRGLLERPGSACGRCRLTLLIAGAGNSRRARLSVKIRSGSHSGPSV
jgi:hypothetical protein